jgi:hypothetical protein
MSDLRSKSSTGTPGSTADVYESIGDRVACLDASGTLMHCNAAYAAAVG